MLHGVLDRLSTALSVPLGSDPSGCVQSVEFRPGRHFWITFSQLHRAMESPDISESAVPSRDVLPLVEEYGQG